MTLIKRIPADSVNIARLKPILAQWEFESKDRILNGRISIGPVGIVVEVGIGRFTARQERDPLLVRPSDFMV